MANQKVALITGGGSGMGQLACKNFAREGWQVAALDINKKGLSNTASGSDKIQTWLVDISDFVAVKAAVDEVEKKLGPVHTVYNCAAIMPFGKLTEQDNHIIHKQMAINYGGLVNITQAALPLMLERREGTFVSFASMAGIIPTLLTGAYSASKSAVMAFNEVLYHENRDSGVAFASVCPPMVNTPLLDQGRATVWPKMLEAESTPIMPQEVLDKINYCLERGEFLVFPGKGTKIGYFFRRLLPGQLWKHVHKVEGF